LKGSYTAAISKKKASCTIGSNKPTHPKGGKGPRKGGTERPYEYKKRG